MRSESKSKDAVKQLEAFKQGDVIGKFTLIALSGVTWTVKCKCGAIEKHPRGHLLPNRGRRQCIKCVKKRNDSLMKRKAQHKARYDASILNPSVYILAFCKRWVI